MTSTIPSPHQLKIPNIPKKSSPSTNLCLLHLCDYLHEANQIHALMVKSSQINDTYSASLLAEFYAVSENGNLDYAEKVLTTMKEPCTFAYNTLIRGNLRKNNTRRAISLYDQMLRERIQADCYTFTFLLKACTQFSAFVVGKQIHSQIIKNGAEQDAFVRNKLINFYSLYGALTEARKLFDTSLELDIVTWNTMLEAYADNKDEELLHRLFDSMPYRDVVSWNTMIAYYVQVGNFKEAIERLRQMHEKGQKPDRVTLVSVVTAITHSGALGQGRWLHAYIKSQKIRLDEILGSALINMYGKSGCLNGAMEAFNETNKKNVDTWNAIISSLATNGHSSKAIEFFYLMEDCNVQPDAITFSSILSACSHAGTVENGIRYFEIMKDKHGIQPDIIHYGCMVDLFGRAGFFDKAKEIIKTMPIKPDKVVWKALLSACRVHKNFELGEQAGLKLIELAPNDHASYVLLSNIYAMQGKWNDVHKVRRIMRERAIKKPPGCSSIEVDGVVHEFIAGDTSHSRKREIYEMLAEMRERLRAAGYQPETDQIMLDIKEEDLKETSLIHHSEKLAVAFALISTSHRMTIRVVKNLRMCSDCHSTMKVVSMIYHRNIIIRDLNRFHYFIDGSCSCMDYW